ncbi:hypothetical protein [Streptomyces sp. NBC_01408]|uniref:hypothetical protein n=1 Tax=Streptomyces sp. NBC_01408 TaxID=2903855 RepID=UPI002251E753|nr:hypothetical protein [Streptomyces sp. NBC_01408]MCX4692284.1 hypothetical protein [Streptomyces sp. NBC_01408]
MAGAGGSDQAPVLREQAPDPGQEQAQAWAEADARVQERMQVRYELPPDPDVHRTHRTQRAIAGGALLLGGLATVWSLGVGTTGLFIPPLLALVVPVVVREAVRFRRICLGLALLLLPVGVVLYLLGAFLLIPSAVLLLLARGADPRRSPAGARVRAGFAGLIGLLMAVVYVYAIVAVASRG